MNDVILFLTSPRTKEREQMSLTNLRQLKKLGKDIIVLSTCSNIDPEYYDLATMVVFDFYNGIVSKGYYKKSDSYPIPYIKPTATFYYVVKSPPYKIYTNTHFLSVFGNTKNLIKLAYSLNYKNFLYVEDDHYFSDFGLTKMAEYFSELNNTNTDAIYFENTWDTEFNKCKVIHSYFWLGKSEYFNESILHKLPERIEDLECRFPYSGDYESFLYYVFYSYVHNKNNVKFESVKERGFSFLFGEDSKINQVYSYCNISDDSRLNILYANKPNFYKLILDYKDFYYMDKEVFNIQVLINDVLHFGTDLRLKQTFNAFDLQLDLTKPTTIKVIYDSEIVKEFKNITHDDVLKNGVWAYSWT